MSTLTRNLTCPPDVALQTVHHALRKLRHKGVEQLPNGLVYHVKTGLRKTEPLTVTITGSTLTIVAPTPYFDGEARRVFNALHGNIDGQGLFEVLPKQKALYDAVLDNLDPDERITAAASGFRDKVPSALLLTTKGVRLVGAKLFESTARIIDPKNITSITSATGALFDSVKLTVSNEEIDLDTIEKGHGSAIVDAIRAAMSTGAASPAPAPASGGLGELTKLAELHQAGVLTDEEFAAAKRKALGI